MNYLKLIILIFSIENNLYSQSSIDTLLASTINKYFTTEDYFLKDTIKTEVFLNKIIIEKLEQNSLYCTDCKYFKNKIILTSIEKQQIIENLSKDFVWQFPIENKCKIINTEMACDILDSINRIGKVPLNKYIKSEISSKEYERLTMKLPYIVYITNPNYFRNKKYLLVGITCIGGGLSGTPCHIFVYKKTKTAYKEYINIKIN